MLVYAFKQVFYKKRTKYLYVRCPANWDIVWAPLCVSPHDPLVVDNVT